MLRGSQPKAKLYDGVTRIHLFLLVPMLAVSLCAAEIDSDPQTWPGGAGPEGQGFDGQHEGKVVARFAEAQVNGTRIRPVLQAIQKAVE